MKNVIYRFFSPKENKSYIGQAIDEKKRYDQHIKSAKNPIYLIDYAIYEQGIENMIYEVLEHDIPEVMLNKKEIEYILKYNAYYRWENGGYNMTLGGASTVKRKTKHVTNKWEGGIPIYGYWIDKNIDKRNVLINEDEAKTIRMIIDEYLSDNYITAKDISEKYDMQINKVYRILQCANIYAGKSIQSISGEVRSYEFHYPVIISEEFADAVMNKLQSKQNLPKASSKHITLLRGIRSLNTYVKYQPGTDSYIIWNKTTDKSKYIKREKLEKILIDQYDVSSISDLTVKEQNMHLRDNISDLYFESDELVVK